MLIAVCTFQMDKMCTLNVHFIQQRKLKLCKANVECSYKYLSTFVNNANKSWALMRYMYVGFLFSLCVRTSVWRMASVYYIMLLATLLQKLSVNPMLSSRKVDHVVMIRRHQGINSANSSFLIYADFLM